MKKLALYSIFAFLSFSCFGQKSLYNFGRNFDVDKWRFYGGAAIGPETGLAGLMPKLSAFRFTEGTNLQYYFGGEFTPWIGFALILSTDISVGIKMKHLSLESSVGVLRYFGDGDYGPFTHGTINPKIGIDLGRFWFKMGPSFFTFKKYAPDPPPVLDLIKFGNQSVNIELLIEI